MGSMKSKKIIAIAKGVWAFCSYLFVPQWGSEGVISIGSHNAVVRIVKNNSIIENRAYE